MLGPAVGPAQDAVGQGRPAIAVAGLELLGLEPAAGRCRQHRDRDHDRQGDGDRDGQREVGEDLAFDVAQKQYGQKDRDRGHGRGDQGGYHFAGAGLCRLDRSHAAFLEPDDVAGNDDRTLDDHAHGESQSGQRNHVEGASAEVERAERCEQANRYRHRDQQGGAPVAHEPPDADQGEQGADDQVFGQQVDRAVDEQRGVVALLDAEAVRLQFAIAQLGDDVLDLFERAEHVGPWRAQHLQADRRIAVLVDEELLVGRSLLDRGDVTELDRAPVAPGQDQVA